MFIISFIRFWSYTGLASLRSLPRLHWSIGDDDDDDDGCVVVADF